MLLALALALITVGCSRQTEMAGSDANTAGLDTSDRETAALVAMAVDYHRKADLALSGEDRAAAKSEMDALLAACDRYDVRTVEAWDVRFDAATRLARLHLEDDALAQADAAVSKGLEGAQDAPPTLFRGYLLQTRADIRERQEDPKAAVESHSEAIEIFKGVLEAERGGLPPRDRGKGQ